MRLVALESWRQACAVVGEDLGTVPEGFRETMRSANVLSYRIFVFERRSMAAFVPPAQYPPLAAASAATHDIADAERVLARAAISSGAGASGFIPTRHAAEAEAAERRRDRSLLLDALVREGLIAPAQMRSFFPKAASRSIRPSSATRSSRISPARARV